MLRHGRVAPQGLPNHASRLGPAEATQRAYLGDIEAFVTWANDSGVTAPNEVNVRTLRDYLSS